MRWASEGTKEADFQCHGCKEKRKQLAERVFVGDAVP